MKKYSIYSLYVVEIQSNGDVQYLICKYNRQRDTYIEIFTNEKLKITEYTNIEPLASYYSILGRRNFSTGKPLMLDKKQLLKKYISINSEASLEKGIQLFQNNNDSIKRNEILEKATINFFSQNGYWYSDCFIKSDDLNMINLPCHLRDDFWLAKMLKQNQRLFYISINSILQFIKTSPFFLKKRYEYEQRIVKWQIDWMKNDGENWIVDESYGGDFVFFTSVCDLGFRKGVVDTLSRIGMSIEAIEEGIERNADTWRDSLMRRAFRNEYEPIFADVRTFLDEDDESKEETTVLEPVDPEFQEKWLRFRKYEYYQRHKNSVDKYGVVEPDMTLSDEEIAELTVYLNQKHMERMTQIEQYKQQRYGTTGQARVLKK